MEAGDEGIESVDSNCSRNAQKPPILQVNLGVTDILDRFRKVVSRRTQLPASGEISLPFSELKMEGDYVTLEVFQGISEIPESNKSLGFLKLNLQELMECDRHMSTVSILFEISDSFHMQSTCWIGSLWIKECFFIDPILLMKRNSAKRERQFLELARMKQLIGGFTRVLEIKAKKMLSQLKPGDECFDLTTLFDEIRVARKVSEGKKIRFDEKKRVIQDKIRKLKKALKDLLILAMRSIVGVPICQGLCIFGDSCPLLHQEADLEEMVRLAAWSLHQGGLPMDTVDNHLQDLLIKSGVGLGERDFHQEVGGYYSNQNM